MNKDGMQNEILEVEQNARYCLGIFFVITLPFVIFIIFFITCFYNSLFSNRILELESTSPTGENTITIYRLQTLLNNAIPIIIIANDGIELGTEIFNDGKFIDESNYFIRWDDDNAIIRLSGEEQEDTFIIFIAPDILEFNE